MAAVDPAFPAAVAVSGGGDSLALMHLLADWARARRVAAPLVVIVDHRLRRGSAAQARRARARAREAGLEARVLPRRGPAPESDIEGAARAARYRLIGEWAREKNVRTVFVAHTLEDQAETFLMRLARGSGLDGLTAMRVLAPYPLAEFADVALARPLLAERRADLRLYLAARGIAWHDDPMNADPRFARVRMRALLPVLEETGMSAARIAAAAAHLSRARDALELATDVFLARAAVETGEGAVALDAEAFAAVPREVGLRALACVLMGVGGAAYRPRFERLSALLDAIAQDALGGGRTLGHCRLAAAPKRLRHFGPATLIVARENRGRMT